MEISSVQRFAAQLNEEVFARFSEWIRANEEQGASAASRAPVVTRRCRGGDGSAGGELIAMGL